MGSRLRRERALHWYRGDDYRYWLLEAACWLAGYDSIPTLIDRGEWP